MKYMKVLTLFFVVCLASCQQKKSDITIDDLKTEVDSISYAVGTSVGKSIQTSFLEFDREKFFAGLQHVIDSLDVLITEEQAQLAIQAYINKNKPVLMKRQQEAMAKEKEKKFGHVKEAGEKFLEENKTEDGVMITESGLQYKILEEGSGEIPEATDKVKVHYTGTLIDGTKFDSSIDRGNPFTFSLTGGVIQGWLEGVKLMSVGSKYKFFIPQELGYGSNPRPGVIRPFDPLIFEIELLEIVKE